VTNAAGGLNPEYEVGDVVVINDVCIGIWSYLPEDGELTASSL
jgi:hypothetical protein